MSASLCHVPRVAGVPFSVNVRLSNSGFFPAVDLRVGWHREGIQDIRRSGESVAWDASPPVGVGVLRSHAVMHWHGSMQYFQRGVHELPPFYVSTLFPFHLFRNQKPFATEAKIAITPQPAHPDDDAATRMVLSSIGEWAGQLVAGAPVEYVGNREYQVGIPVRRWDFASWARLGRPIVREYQSPSIQAVTLIVDTSLRVTGHARNRAAAKRERAEAIASLERLMSIAATAIAELGSRRVKLDLVLTSESDADLANHRAGSMGEQSEELMLVRLAAAGAADPQQAQQRMIEAVSSVRSQQTMLLSLFKLDSPERRDLATELPSTATYIAIDDPAADSQANDPAPRIHLPASPHEAPA